MNHIFRGSLIVLFVIAMIPDNKQKTENINWWLVVGSNVFMIIVASLLKPLAMKFGLNFLGIFLSIALIAIGLHMEKFWVIGLWILILGGCMNDLVMIANKFRMPYTLLKKYKIDEDGEKIEYLKEGDVNEKIPGYVLMTEKTRLNFLGDWIVVSETIWVGNRTIYHMTVMSPGDILIYAGCFLGTLQILLTR